MHIQIISIYVWKELTRKSPTCRKQRVSQCGYSFRVVQKRFREVFYPQSNGQDPIGTCTAATRLFWSWAKGIVVIQILDVTFVNHLTYWFLHSGSLDVCETHLLSFNKSEWIFLAMQSTKYQVVLKICVQQSTVKRCQSADSLKSFFSPFCHCTFWPLKLAVH